MPSEEYEFKYDVRLNYTHVSYLYIQDLLVNLMAMFDLESYNISTISDSNEARLSVLISDRTLSEASKIASDTNATSFELFKKEV